MLRRSGMQGWRAPQSVEQNLSFVWRMLEIEAAQLETWNLVLRCRGTRKLRDELKDHSDESLQETLLAAQLQESLLWAYILWQLADSSQIPSIQSDYLQINISYGWRLLDQLSAIFVKFDTSINKAKSLGVNHTLSRRCAKFLSKVGFYFIAKYGIRITTTSSICSFSTLPISSTSPIFWSPKTSPFFKGMISQVHVINSR